MSYGPKESFPINQPVRAWRAERQLHTLNGSDQDDQDYKDRIYSRLQERSEINPKTECCIYLGSTDLSGRAKVAVGQKRYWLVKVAAWLFFPGFELWDKRVAFHTCRNPACFAAEHIRIAKDHADAMRQLRALGLWGSASGRNRQSRPGRRLSRERALQIQAEHQKTPNLTVVAQAEAYGVSEKTIRACRRGSVYANSSPGTSAALAGISGEKPHGEQPCQQTTTTITTPN